MQLVSSPFPTNIYHLYFEISLVICSALCLLYASQVLLKMDTAHKPDGLVNQAIDSYGEPPPYAVHNQHQPNSKWTPRHWTRSVILSVVVATIVLLAVIIVGAVVGSKAKMYPDYKPLKYALVDTYSGTDFFEPFDYFTGYDPSAGFVHYVPRETAMPEQSNLTYASSDSAVMRVDTTQTDAPTGRYSVRIASKKKYNSGLFIFDILNTPYGCSTWPALWLTDPSNWPKNGGQYRSFSSSGSRY